MGIHTVTFYPVDNGDTTLIALGDDTTVLIDCNVREASEDPDAPECYDVKGDLLRRLRRDEQGRPHLDAFVLTHPDQDHCCGFGRLCWSGDPSGYDPDSADEEQVIVDELWFAPRIFVPCENDLCDDARVFRAEARRRIKLYKAGAEERDHAGNRLRVTVYSDTPALEGLGDILTAPGGVVNLVNGDPKQDFRFRVLAPVRDDTDNEWANRNDTSVVLLAAFDVGPVTDAGIVFLGGDAGCAIWERIWQVSGRDLPRWDLFLAPHHCSWSFFSEEPLGDEPEPSPDILKLLDHRNQNGIVVASCKPIRDDDDNPPHTAAAERYRGIVGADGFWCTATFPKEEAPQPLVFEMRGSGAVGPEDPDGSSKAASQVARVVSVPQRYG